MESPPPGRSYSRTTTDIFGQTSAFSRDEPRTEHSRQLAVRAQSVLLIIAEAVGVGEAGGEAALLLTFLGVVSAGILTIGFTFNEITHWFI